MKQPYTYSMPESFLKDKSVPARWRVLGVINGFILNGGCFYGSNEWLMVQLGCSEPTISAAFAELETLNLVEISRTARTRKVYRKAHDPNQLGSETQTEHVHDPSQLVPNSVSNSEKNTGASEDGQRSVKVSDLFKPTPFKEEDAPSKRENRTKDKLAVYSLFSKTEQPWWRHKQQKDAALSLFDLVGVERVEKMLRFARENADDTYCPQPQTPFEFEEKMPKLSAYAKRNR